MTVSCDPSQAANDPGDDVGWMTNNYHRSEQFAGEVRVESLASRT
jgi:hypothetical protein